MLDYSLVAAVAAVVREGSFERAAVMLHVTPSAVSQRVKLLEERLGQVLVVRGQPCTATAAGLALCRHEEQVSMLEAELALAGAPVAPGADAPVTLRVAVNADSLATWFIGAAAAFAHDGRALLDVRLEDEDHTAQQLRNGEVIAAVTALAEPVQGCSSLPLGRMRYLATASPTFMQRHFGDKGLAVDAQTLAAAPCLTFNQKDRLQTQWQQAQFGKVVAAHRHWLPASQAFVDAALAGLGWGMNPASLVRGHLQAGRLVELLPGRALHVALFWQHPRSAAPMLTRLTSAVVNAARETLEADDTVGR
ncbi:MAG TPA: LysR family transcriptional regulator ArgP [Rubrivivax sp.]|nr:LysR family transcriptional regulator ArgP [Rubrivivax sp.]